MNIRGFVRNESDGSVYIEAEGEEEALAQFVAWCKKGPRLAEVYEIKAESETMRGFKDFQVG